MASFYLEFFKSHPDPMWIQDAETSKIIDVNASALARYGYAEPEFLALAPNDIEAAASLDATERAAEAAAGQDISGVSRHCAKDGSVFHVDVSTHIFEHEGRGTKLITARDVSRLVEFELGRAEAALLVEERAARLAAEDAALTYRSLFESVPEKLLVIRPDDLTIVSASDAYLAATAMRRAEIVGKPIIDIIVDDHIGADAATADRLRASLQRVHETGQPDSIAIQRYPVHGSAGGSADDARYVTVVNTPVRGMSGKLTHIIHRIEDVTDYVRSKAGLAAENDAAKLLEDKASRLELDVFLRAGELQAMNDRLKAQAIKLRTAQRIAKIGSWQLDVARGDLSFSDEAYSILAMEREGFAHTGAAFLELVHEGDRADIQVRLASVLAGGPPLDLIHRVIRSDGEVRYIHALAQLSEIDGRRVLSGTIKDITIDRIIAIKAEESAFLLRAAGRVARLGGWALRVGAENVEWSEETLAIHELLPGTLVSAQQAYDFYTPESRPRLEDVMAACIADGTPFDEVLQIKIASGRKVWVRTVGEALRDDDGTVTSVLGAFQDISELVEARIEVERVSEQVRRTLNNISEGFYTLDRDERFTFINQLAAQLFGVTTTSVIGQSAVDVFPDSATAELGTNIRRAIASGEPSSFVIQYGPDKRWFDVRAYPGADGLAVFFKDVSAEHAQQQQLRMLDAAVSRQSDIVLITEAEPFDEPGPRIVYVNDAFTLRTGYTREEALGRSPRFLQGPKTQRHELDRIRAALQSREPVRAELINYTKSGEEFWLDLSLVPIPDDKGWHTHWVAIERDITERKRNEQIIAISEERFRLISRATTDVVWDWNIADDTVWWSDGMHTIFGHDLARMSLDPLAWSLAIWAEDRDRVLNGIAQCVEGTQSTWQESYRFVRANGTIAHVEDRAFVIRDESGAALRMIGSMTDATERGKLEDQLRQAQRLEAVGQLTGGIAHDFNNLLTVILGNAEMLTEHLSGDAKMRRLAEMTQHAAERGAELTTRLLAFARQQTLDPQATEIRKLMESIDPLLNRALGEHIDIKFECPAGLWDILIDPPQLENALLNLCINARDAMPGGGHLIIQAENMILGPNDMPGDEDAPGGEFVAISISDSGTGMDAETLARAFEPFYTTKEVGKGSGLGLSMVYGFVKQSKGHVKLDSEFGNGSTVTLYLPRARDRAHEQNEPADHEARPGGHERILMVEDDELVRGFVAERLASLGYSVVAAANGHEALALIKEDGAFDLLFTDVVMPGGLSGPELAAQVVALYPGIRVLFTSGYAEDAVFPHGQRASGFDLLHKPYRRAALAAKLRKVLGHEDPLSTGPS